MTNNPTGWTSGSAEKLKYLTEEQVRRFFAAIKAVKDPIIRARDLCLFNLMLSFGLRVMEISLIKWDEHVNLKVRPPQIYITRVKEKHWKKDPKTGKKVYVKKPRQGKWYDLSDSNAALIKAWLSARKKYRHHADSTSLFITRESGAFSAPHVYDSVIKYGRAAGIVGIHPHMLRHTCGIRLAKAGRNAFAIQKRLGHVSVISTQCYTDIAGADRHEEDRQDDAAIEGAVDEQ